MNDLVMLLIAALMVAIVIYIVSLRKKLARVSTNPNFNVATRVAALEERRKTKRLQSVVAFDIGGMGKANQLRGEEWVNRQIKIALDEVKASLRSTDTIAQLNSGDEFFIVVEAGDELMVMNKIFKAFRSHWEGGVYVASTVVTDDVMDSVAMAMENVYLIKAVYKSRN